MAKSSIIKELANSTIDTSTALKRLKILLFNLNKPEINNWVDCELNGYKNIDDIPSYRRFKGQITANFIIATSVSMTKYSNTPLPTSNIPSDIKDAIEEVVFCDGISAIKSMEGEKLGRIIPPEFYEYITQGTNISSVTSARVNITKSAPLEVIAAVESKILEILVVLETEFGNLDELDIDCSSKTEQEIIEVCKQIVNIIYVDKGVTIGDNNKLSKTNISTQ